MIVVAKLVQSHNEGARSSSALDLLEERYARGEISREEFLERKAVLLGETDPQHTS